MCAHIGGYDRDLQFVAWRHDLTSQCVRGAKKLRLATSQLGISQQGHA